MNSKISDGRAQRADDQGTLVLPLSHRLVLAMVAHCALECVDVRAVWCKLAEREPALSEADFNVIVAELVARGLLRVAPDCRLALADEDTASVVVSDLIGLYPSPTT